MNASTSVNVKNIKFMLKNFVQVSYHAIIATKKMAKRS